MRNPNASIEGIANGLNLPLDKIVKLSPKKIEELVDLFFAKEKAETKYEAFLILNKLN